MQNGAKWLKMAPIRTKVDLGVRTSNWRWLRSFLGSILRLERVKLELVRPPSAGQHFAPRVIFAGELRWKMRAVLEGKPMLFFTMVLFAKARSRGLTAYM